MELTFRVVLSKSTVERLVLFFTRKEGGRSCLNTTPKRNLLASTTSQWPASIAKQTFTLTRLRRNGPSVAQSVEG